MAKRSKQQTQLVVLGVLAAAIVGVLIFIVSGGGEIDVATYEPRRVDPSISEAVFDHPEFRRLEAPVDLPLSPGPMGRKNPFIPVGNAGAE